MKLDPKIIAIAATALATAFGGGGLAGYDKRDDEVDAALSRAKCKLKDLKVVAEACGWERPANWCSVPLEEQ